MVGVKEEVLGNEHGYFLAAGLVNKLIAAIILAIISVGGYMIVWALNDAEWKAAQAAKMDTVVRKADAFDFHLLNHPDRDLDRRIIRLEDKDVVILEKVEKLENTQDRGNK